jgi:hypothetical protein
MKSTTQLQLVSNGKTLGSIDLDPVTQLRLLAYAKVNEIDLIEMIDRAVWFTTASETEGDKDEINIECPEEDYILALAAEMVPNTLR